MGAFLFPSRGAVRPVNPVVEGVLNALANKNENYIGATLPTVNAPREVVGGELRVHTTGTVFTMDVGDMFGSSSHDGEWPSKSAPSMSIGVRPGNVTYDCTRYGRDAAVDLWTEAQSEMPVTLNQVEMAAVMEFLKIQREIRFRDFCTSTSWSNSITLLDGDAFGTASGSDIAANNSSDPMGILLDAAEKIRDYGQDPNYLVIPRKPARALQKHTAILDYLPTTERRITMTPNRLRAVLAAELEIPESNIHFGRARQNTARDGAAVSLADVHDETIFLGYVDANPTVSANAGTGDIRVSATAGMRVEAMPFSPRTIRDEYKDCEIQRIWHSETYQIVMPELGCRIINTIA